MFEEKCVLANSPSLMPRPVKSKRSTPIPDIASRSEMRLAARLSLPQVKQCANNAKATGLPSGRSIKAASFSPFELVNSVLSVRTICPFSETDSLRQEPAQAAED